MHQIILLLSAVFFLGMGFFVEMSEPTQGVFIIAAMVYGVGYILSSQIAILAKGFSND